VVNILIVEDERQQRKNLMKMIYQVDNNIKIYEAESKEEAMKISKEIDIGFFYVDISLKDSSGLDLALELRNIKKYKLSWIVFITTHINYMISAFKEVHCYDYIIKPYNKDEVIGMTKLLISGSHTLNFSKSKDKHIVFELQKGISMKINVDEIIFIEVNFRIMTLCTKRGNYKIKKLTLSKALEIINSNNIVQSHKSFAINIDYINNIEKISNKLWQVGFENCEEKALLSYNFKDDVMEKFKQPI
jgi:DNA-binding LytR/AlgR family response regulator